jgi:small ubiquitin-related modifier
MSDLLSSYKAMKPRPQKREFNAKELGLDSDDEDDDLAKKRKIQRNAARRKKGSDSDSLGDSSDDDLDKSMDDDDDEEGKSSPDKSRGLRMAADLLKKIGKESAANNLSPPPPPSSVGTKRGRGGKGKGKKGNAAAASLYGDDDKEMQELIKEVDAKKMRSQKAQRIQELEAKAGARRESDVIVNLNLPEVLTAKQRDELKNKRDSMEVFELLDKDLRGSGGTDDDGGIDSAGKYNDDDEGDDGEAAAAAAAAAVGNNNGGGALLSIKTRLNGHSEHEHVFSVAPTDTFAAIRALVSGYYGLNTRSGLKLMFDGQELKGKGTPEDEDMEDEDLVDITVNATAFDNAVATAKGKEEIAVAADDDAQNEKNNGGGKNNNTEKVKFKTRLNGQHEHRWMVGKEDAFSKIKGKFADVYGLSLRDIKKFEFDGEAIDDDETPSTLDMDNGDLIDVTIDAKKLDGALAHETSKSKKPASSSSSSSSSASSSSSSSASAGKGNFASPDANNKTAGSSSSSSGKGKSAASKKRENRVEVRFNIVVSKSVSVNGERAEACITYFADELVDRLVELLTVKKKLLKDIPVNVVILRDRGHKQVQRGKTLMQNSIMDNSTVEFRLPNIGVKIKPSGIALEGSSQFVGEFEVQSANPEGPLKTLMDSLMKSGHLVYPRDQLTFTMVGASGSVCLDEVDETETIGSYGFQDKCELFVTKR